MKAKLNNLIQKLLICASIIKQRKVDYVVEREKNYDEARPKRLSLTFDIKFLCVGAFLYVTKQSSIQLWIIYDACWLIDKIILSFNPRSLRRSLSEILMEIYSSSSFPWQP